MSRRIRAWCNVDGLIGFGGRIPHDAYPLLDGTEDDMEIVRKFAHKDGRTYWVPGIRDGQDWEDRIEQFKAACTEQMNVGAKLCPTEGDAATSYHDWIQQALDKST